MNIFPAIDLIDGCAVRLYKGDYSQKTVYSDNPADVAKSFVKAGAEYIHIVDLDGARDGSNANLTVISKIISESGLKAEVGGGIRSVESVKKYLDIGVMRVILGTAAVKDPGFLENAVKTYGEKVAVGVDIKDGKVTLGRKVYLYISFYEEIGHGGSMIPDDVKDFLAVDIACV